MKRIKGWKMVVFVWALGSIAYLINNSRIYFADREGMPTIQQESQPDGVTTGVIDLTTEWQGVPLLDSTKRITATILTKGVWWQTRLDRDDSRVYDINPDVKGHREVPEASFWEWRIRSGQAVSNGTLVWEIGPQKRK